MMYAPIHAPYAWHKHHQLTLGGWHVCCTNRNEREYQKKQCAIKKRKIQECCAVLCCMRTWVGKINVGFERHPLQHSWCRVLLPVSAYSPVLLVLVVARARTATYSWSESALQTFKVGAAHPASPASTAVWSLTLEEGKRIQSLFGLSQLSQHSLRFRHFIMGLVAVTGYLTIAAEKA